MDHWGDPWADDAEPTTTALKREEHEEHEETATKSVASAGPVVFGGFLDDAQWGADGEEEGLEGWGGAPVQGGDGRADEEDTSVAARDQVHVEEFEEIAQEDDRGYGLHTTSTFDIGDEGWGSMEKEEDSATRSEQVVSEASDSATTMQADDTPEKISQDLHDSPHRDDDMSTRPSTSPSDVSHTEPLSESPRTSIEEERTLAKEMEVPPISAEEEKAPTVTDDVVEANKVSLEDGEETDDEFGEFEDDTQDTIPEETPSLAVNEVSSGEANVSAPVNDNSHFVPPKPLPQLALAADLVLINKLFPPSKRTEEPLEAPDTPISTTSARKAWYHLTRKQTLREYNSGADENNYVRVTWANSTVRTDVAKIVGRWAHEDRISGRGQAARASFYWDSKPAPEPRMPMSHTRKRSSIAVLNPIRQTKPIVQPITTSSPAAQFNWSSEPLASPDPWQQSSPTVRAVSSPITPKHIAVTKLQKPHSRASSLDLARQDPMQTAHRSSMETTSRRASPMSRRLSSDNQSSGIIDSTGSLQPNATSETLDPWASLGALDTASYSPPKNSTANDDDDDEWGEMVQSPAISSADTMRDPSQTMAFDTPHTPFTTPAKSVSQSGSASRDAAQIVRLKGTVSPTSALFRFNSFVPAGTEEGPIGPGLLKPTTAPRENTPDKASTEIAPNPSNEEEIARPPLKTSTTDDFTAFESSLPSPDPELERVAVSRTPIVASPIQKDHMHDRQVDAPSAEQSLSTSLFDADFSIFESNPPALVHQPPMSDPSDPLSFFDNPISVPVSVSKREVRDTPVPPPKLPLTGASNSAQRRKEEEDEIIKQIVDGLPDLSFMLRR